MNGFFVMKRNNKDEIQKLLDNATDAGLMACGMYAESAAKKSLTASGAVDTGLLRNSVTFAISGEAAHKSSYKANRAKGKKPKATGSYEGTLEEEEDGVKTVAVGTNVEYAPSIEFGRGSMGARPFIRTAISENGAKFIQLLRKYMENA